MCVFPTPGGPSRAALALASTKDRVVRSLTLRGSSSGWNEKSYSSSVLWCGSLDSPQALAEAAVVADGEFLGQDQVEEVEVAHLRLVRPAGVLVDGLRQVGQAELAGRGADAVAGQLVQDDSFDGKLVVKGRVPVSSS